MIAFESNKLSTLSQNLKNFTVLSGIIVGGNYKRSGYVQYVPVILADVPALTTFINKRH